MTDAPEDAEGTTTQRRRIVVLGGGTGGTLAANRLEDGSERLETVTPRDEQSVTRGGQHSQVGVQRPHVRLEVAFLLLVAFADQLVEDLVEHVQRLVSQAGRKVRQVRGQ